MVVEILNFLVSDEVLHSFLFFFGQNYQLLAALFNLPLTSAINLLVFVKYVIHQVRDQDIIYGLSHISFECRDIAWNWLKVCAVN